MKTRINLFIFPVVLTLLGSCGNGPQLKDGDTISFPDTSAFKQSWHMEEIQMLDDLFATDTLYNQLGLDTLELTYRMCSDCPDWIDLTKGDIDCKECTDFYIEPADPSLQLPDGFYFSGNTIRFYGVRIPGIGLPMNQEFSSEHPIPWTIFRYYGYEVVRPYKIRGPEMKIYGKEGDTASTSIILTLQ